MNLQIPLVVGEIYIFTSHRFIDSATCTTTIFYILVNDLIYSPSPSFLFSVITNSKE